MGAHRVPRTTFRLLLFLTASVLAPPLPAADITPERLELELALPLDAAGLPPGDYLVSGVLTAGGGPLGTFWRIPRLHLPCPNPPCAAVVRAEVPFKGVTEGLLASFIDGNLKVAAETVFKVPGGGGERRAAIPLALTPVLLGAEAGLPPDLARVEAVALDAPTGRLRLTLRLFNPLPFPARLEGFALKVRPGTRNAYDLEEKPGLTLPPGETTHEAEVKVKAEDLLVIASRKVATQQFDLSVEARVEGRLTVSVAGRTVEVSLGE
jgi:hypothetical protein